MNGEGHVRAKGREAVQRVIADMGYQPAVFARGLSSARSFLLTLFIAGLDNAPTARLAWPPLTTVRQPVKQMAALVVEMLAEPEYRDSMAAPKWQRSLPFDLVLLHLVLRESVAVPPPAYR